MSPRPGSVRPALLAMLLTVLIGGALLVAVIGASGSRTPRPPTETRSTTSHPTSDSSPTEQPDETAAPPNEAPSADHNLGCDGLPVGTPAHPELASALTRIAAEWGADFEAAWLEPGAGIIQVNGLPNRAAWSTSKVPLALAVVQAGQGDAQAAAISSALRVSDNDAALRLWQFLGPTDASRAAAVTGVLRQGGDQTTVVPQTQLHPPYTIFGQTQWGAAEQVGFATQLPCLDGAGQVINDMGQISPGHSWGLGRLPGAVFKGGWGPDADGYLVRQFGWYTGVDGSRVPIAIAVQAPSFEIGIGVLDAMASQLS